MSSITLEGVGKRFGNFTAVQRMDLAVENGEFVAILGPSGCGKSTTMNMVAGLESVSDGRIRFGDRDVTDEPVERRGVGFVFQNYAIFTHMSVRRNLEFGLLVQGRPASERRRAVERMAEFMELTARLDQNAATLSVNELQKLAIGRSAIVEPAIFLLDEPLSNLDAAFRERMRSDLRQIQQRLGQTMLYVTHDQIEAMGLADRIAVMSNGELQQFDTPGNIYREPANVYVARFIGAPSMNILPAELVEGGRRVRVGGNASGATSLEVPTRYRGAVSDRLARGGLRSTSLLLGFRPEAVDGPSSGAEPGSDGPGVMRWSLAPTLIETVGRRRIGHFELAGTQLRGTWHRSVPLCAGVPVDLVLGERNLYLFDADDERALPSEPMGEPSRQLVGEPGPRGGITGVSS